MLDSIYPGNLPAGADAYLAYPDGAWPTAAAVKAKFPGKHVLVLSVFARDVSEGYDREPLDVDVTELAAAIKRSMAAGIWRPVCYASAANMTACMAALRQAAIPLNAVRLLTAHYGAGQHICGPHTCGLVVLDMDGTQWRDNAPGVGGSLVDESVLLDDFFGAQPAPVRSPTIPVPVEEPDMIIFNVDQKSVPPGAPWPGTFLLAADATLHHITSPADLASYQAAGLKEETFSFAEYLARGGVPGVPVRVP
jgi:hypothetical protein